MRINSINIPSNDWKTSSMMAALDADVAVSVAGGELIHPESGVRDLAGGSDPKHYIT